MDIQPLSFYQRLRIILRMVMSLFVRPKPPSRPTWPGSSDFPSLPYPSGPWPKLEELQRVIAVGQTQSVGGLDVTFLSLESYHNGFLVLGHHSSKYGEHGPNNLWHAILIFTSVDDLGNSYQWFPTGGNRNRFECAFTPALHADACELTLTITQVRWTVYREHRHRLDDGPWTFTVPLA